MTVEVKRSDSIEEIDLKMKEITDKISNDKKKLLKKYFGSIKLNEDPVVMQRKWRDE